MYCPLIIIMSKHSFILGTFISINQSINQSINIPFKASAMLTSFATFKPLSFSGLLRTFYLCSGGNGNYKWRNTRAAQIDQTTLKKKYMFLTPQTRATKKEIIMTRGSGINWCLWASHTCKWLHMKWSHTATVLFRNKASILPMFVFYMLYCKMLYCANW